MTLATTHSQIWRKENSTIVNPPENENVSNKNLKHISKHLPDFQEYESSITLDDVAQLGIEVASRPENLIGTPSGRQVFEQNVMLGGQEVRVRAVLNSIGSLRSVHIRNRSE